MMIASNIFCPDFIKFGAIFYSVGWHNWAVHLKQWDGNRKTLVGKYSHIFPFFIESRPKQETIIYMLVAWW